MASLREVKNRISSVEGTRKITSAMRMVASAKLARVEEKIENMLPYQQKLDEIVGKLLSSMESIKSPFIVEREPKRIALIAVSSNTTLCGAYNANVFRETTKQIKKLSHLGEDSLFIYPIGNQIHRSLKKAGYNLMGSYTELADNPTYSESYALAEELMDDFKKGKIDKVMIVYHHFRSIAAQELRVEQFLPFDLSAYKAEKEDKQGLSSTIEYLIEPNQEELIEELLPKVISQKLFTTLVDTNAAEHGARSMAMQLATDNADDMVEDLTKLYNKSRQQAVTNELLDIIGGSMR